MIKNFFDDNNINYTETPSLKNYNTYHVDVKCSYMVFPNNEQELISILKELKKENIKYTVLGNGSNVIFNTDFYEGVIIKLDKFNTVKYEDNCTITVGAGYPLIKLALETIDKGYSGLEFATGIPGCIGASTAMNAGAYNQSMSDIVKEVKVLTDNYEIKILSNQEMEYSYRDSILKSTKDYIVLETKLKLSLGNISEMKELIEERKMKRINTQPLDKPNAGSVFRNPENMYAGALIENSNLKGFHINDAEVSRKHANFIINSGSATGKDIVKLIGIIKEKVKENYGVELKLEQIIIE